MKYLTAAAAAAAVGAACKCRLHAGMQEVELSAGTPAVRAPPPGSRHKAAHWPPIAAARRLEPEKVAELSRPMLG